jgi:hypothetical protein
MFSQILKKNEPEEIEAFIQLLEASLTNSNHQPTVSKEPKFKKLSAA